VTSAEQLAIELGAPLGDRNGTKLVPMLCGRDETGERVLGHEGWLFELKLDGVRIIADKRGARVSLGYRRLRDATDSYPEIAEALARLGEERVVLDGEVVAFDEQGKPDFQRLGSRIHVRGTGARRAMHDVPVVYVVFDILVVGERDVTGLPLEARKRILERLLGETSGLIRLHPTFDDGRTLFRLCREQGLEGVVAKRLGTTYRPDDRSTEWVKVKCELDADLVVVGWTEGEGKRSSLGALDIAAYDGGRLVMRGSVGSGLDDDQIDALHERLLALEVPKPMAEGKPTRAKRGRHFTRPELVVSVRYMGTSREGTLRHPVFRGLRDDLAPEDCILPSSEATTSPERSLPRRRGTAPSSVVLSDGTTKGALCTYYEAVAPTMLPHLKGRICLPVRGDAPPGPRGRAAPPAWPLPEWTPSWVRTCVVARAQGEVRGVIVDDVDTLRFLVEAGYASLSATAVREAAPSTTDLVALGLHGDAAWRVALHAREMLVAAGLSPFVKGASASLLEVVVPLGDAPAESGAALGALLARMLAPTAEGLGVTVQALRAPVAPYAVVVPVPAGRRASASLPLAWEELEADLGDETGLDRVVDRLALPHVDPMGAMLSASVRFADVVRALEAMVAAGPAGKDGSFVRDPGAR
jgi:bifunctional non-homologous end joining protein LigD